MRTIKLIIIALILGLAGIVYAAGSQQSPAPTDVKEKASCCASHGDSCCMKGQKSGDAKAAHKSCDMSKPEGCCGAESDRSKGKADCCKPGAECCKAGADCCKIGNSCCEQKQAAHNAQGKAQDCDMQKDGKGCGGAACECCKEKTTKQ